MIVGVPRESYPGERRVALVPMVVPSLVKAGFEVVIEAGAGVEAGYPDADYVEKGAKIAPAAPTCSAPPTSWSRFCATAPMTNTGEADLPLAPPRPGADRVSAASGVARDASGSSPRPASPRSPSN